MNFQIEHHQKQSQFGHDFQIEVSLEENDQRMLESVDVYLDGRYLNRPYGMRHSALRRYRKTFQGVGEFIPGKRHQLVIRVTLSDHSQASSAFHWLDPGSPDQQTVPEQYLSVSGIRLN
jgi:hypothetical protein